MKEEEKKYIKGPLNYTGGKYKLLKDILPHFPAKINTFVDLFAGGFNVGINVEANKIICNDRISYLLELYEYFRDTNIGILLSSIDKVIANYGLDHENLSGYNKLREDYNKTKSPLYLFVLTCYAFNHQIRFNNSFEFNSSYGKNLLSYNNSIKQNLVEFCGKLHTSNITFTNADFRNLDIDSLNLGPDDVVYCDPPYLISSAAYNDGKRGFGDWKQEDDDALMSLLDHLNFKGIPFFLSDVFYHKGMSNDRLIEWSKKYTVIYLDKSYAGCNYHIKDRTSKTVEVLITNQPTITKEAEE